jgi:beta-phosphoglucomutase-like phosphatase (HAD superfamily)
VPTPTTLIIFDCDGTIIDSESVIARARAGLAIRYGLAMDPEYALSAFRGTPTQRTIDEIASHLGHTPPGLWDEYLEIVFEMFDAELTPVPHAVEALDWLTNNFDGSIAVGTSGPRDVTRRKLEMTKLDTYFPDAVFTVDDANGIAKPAPDIFLYAARAMGNVPTDQCLVIEDTPVGVAAARAANMPVIGYTGCANDDEAAELAQLGIPTFADLRDVKQFVS